MMAVVINEWKHHGYLGQRTTEDKYNRIALLFKAALDMKFPQRTQLPLRLSYWTYGVFSWLYVSVYIQCVPLCFSHLYSLLVI